MKKSHICQASLCENTTPKNKYGNYKQYCCKECQTATTKIKFKNTYKNKDMNSILEKRKATNIAKFGVDNVSKTEDVKTKLRITTAATAEIRTRKTKETNLKNHGVESTNSLRAVKDKKKETFIEKYGVDHQLKIPSIAASVSKKNTENAKERLAKAAVTNLEKYGYENPSSNADVKQRRTDTMIERFGVENASQNAEIHEKKIKNSYKSKQYVMPSGNVVFVQGFEPRALDELLKEYTEEEIIIATKLKPRITYVGGDGKEHYYFPDFYIPKDNLIIEVKSKWTYTQNKTVCDIKRDATVEAGYDYRFMIF